jgi:hypothetical protein
VDAKRVLLRCPHLCTRSLFTKDKLLFSFLMTCHLKAHITKTLDLAQLRFLLTGETSGPPPPLPQNIRNL